MFDSQTREYETKINNALTEDDIIRMNAASNRGKIVGQPKGADIVFMTEREMQDYLEIHGEHSLDGIEIHFPNDYAYFTGVLMAEPPKDGSDLFHPDMEENIEHSIFEDNKKEEKYDTAHAAHIVPTAEEILNKAAGKPTKNTHKNRDEDPER